MSTQLSRRKALLGMGLGAVGCGLAPRAKAASPREPVVTVRTTGQSFGSEVFDREGRRIWYVTKAVVLREEDGDVALLEMHNWVRRRNGVHVLAEELSKPLDLTTNRSSTSRPFLVATSETAADGGKITCWRLEKSGPKPDGFPRVYDWDDQLVDGVTVVGLILGADAPARFIVECPARLLYEAAEPKDAAQNWIGGSVGLPHPKSRLRAPIGYQSPVYEIGTPGEFSP